MFTKLGIALLCFLLAQADNCGSKSGADQKPAGAPSASASPAAPASNAPVVAAAGSQPGAGAQPTGGASADAAAKSKSDTCSLIERSEIEAVQHAKVQGVAPSERTGDGLAISQCFYTVTSDDGSKNLSVHLEVMRNDAAHAGGDALGGLWRERFRAAKDKRKTFKPRAVEGVGDEAYWVGNNRVGTLYALKKDKLVRVSVGGPEGEDLKIEKSKTLARSALQRLD